MANPKTFQQLLNNMLPPKVVDGVTYVPRVTQASDGEIQTFFASRDGRQHGGIDILYGRLNTTSSRVDSVGSKEALNQNVLIGAPVDGVLRIVTERSGSKLAIVEGTDGVEYVIRHMSNLPGALDGQTIRAGTVIGTMSNVGMNGGAVHDHLSAYTYAQVDGQVQRVAVDPYTLYKNNFDYSKTDMILLRDQQAVGYSTVGRYIPSELVSKEDRNPTLDGVYQYDNTTPLKSTPIGGIQAFGEYLRGLESGGNYSAVNTFGALGAYQMLPDALQQAKYQNANGTWTGKDGVWSKEDFLGNKTAQDNAFASNYESVKAQLKSNGAWAKIGETMPDGTVLTEASLIGAGWLGAGNVGNYFNTDGAFNRADANGASVAYRLRSFSRFDPSLPESDAVASSPTAIPPGGYWDDRTIYDIATGWPIGGENKVWVPDKPAIASASGTAAGTSKPTPSNPSTSDTFQLSPDGKSATLPNGQVISAGTGGRLDMDAAGNLTVTRPASGYEDQSAQDGPVFNITQYSKNGQTQSSAQVQIVFDPNHPGDVSRSTAVVQGQKRDIILANEDGTTSRVKAVFQVGTGWVEPGTGELVQSVKAWVESPSLGSIAQPLPVNYLPVTPATPSAPVNFPEGAGDKDYVNEFDLQSDQYAPPNLVAGAAPDDLYQALLNAFQNTSTSTGATTGTVYAQAGTGTVSDAGGGASNTGSTFTFANLTPTQLAAALQSGNAGGAYGAGQIEGNSFVAINATSKVLLDAQGQVIGEANVLANGYTRFTDKDGNTAYTNPNGQAVSAETYQVGQATAGLSLANAFISLQNWDKQTSLGQLGTVVGMYNSINTLSEGVLGANSGLGSLGSLGAGLGFLSALESGDAGRSVYSGLSLVENLTTTAAGTGTGWVSMNMPGGANVMPGLNLALAVISGDPLQMLSAAVAFIPGWGPILSIGISLFGGLFGGSPPDIPMREGIAHAEWDAQGNTIVVTDKDTEGGGATAANWMSSLVNGLQAQLATTFDANGNSYALIPNLLPAIGFQYDPDGFNLANGAKGFMVLRWTDEQGNQQTRYYDGAGSRGDGTGETLASDFMQHAKGAIAPAWQVNTALAHYQQGQGIQLPKEEAGLPQGTGDGIHQSLTAITLALPAEPALQDTLIDIDGDGYLEQSQWLANNQTMLGIDANGNGQIDAGELIKLGGPGLNALSWLDATGDGKITASDPAFTALRLWLDVNSDASSQGETQTLTQAGIVAIDFTSNPPHIQRADGSATSLTVQTLTADTLGTQYQNTQGGVLQLDEQRNADGTLAAPNALLHAVNTRQFDGQAAHINGGIAAATTPGTSTSTVDAGDTRLSTTTARTIANQSTQTTAQINAGDARLQSTPITLRQAQGERSVSQTAQAAQIRNSSVNALAFVPLGSTSAAQEQRNATEAMIRSAGSNLFDTAGALPLAAVAVGVAAVQWPTVSSAASSNSQDTNAGSWIAGQARNDSGGGAGSSAGGSDSSIFVSSNITSVIPAVIPDVIRDPVRDSNSSLNGSNTSNTPAQSQFEASNQAPAQQIRAQTATESIAPQNTSNAASSSATRTGTRSDDDNDSNDNDNDNDNDNNSSQATTFTNSAGIQLAYPRARGETAAGVEDTQLRFAQSVLLANDSTDNVASNPNQPALRITAVFFPTHGNVSLQTGADGLPEIVFNPDRNYHGQASFSYTVTDQYGLSSVATTTLNIAAVNDAPVAVGETANGDEDNTLQFTAATLLANDTDVDTPVDGDVLRITRVGSAQHGQVFLAPDGTVSFVPDTNYNGPAQFDYWVGDRTPAQLLQGEGFETQATMRLTVLPVNDLPVVTGEALTSDEDIVLNINPALLLANDTDVDTATNGQTLSISAVSNAQHGTIALLPNGTLQFTPEQNYFGAAGFSYTVSDGAGGLVTGQVAINLAPINDAPVLVGETITFNEDSIQTISQASLLANDSDADNPHSDLRIIAVGNATHGTIALNPDGSIRFAPDADYFGPASFTYTVSDGTAGVNSFSIGTATLDITPVNDAPRLLGENLTLNEDTQAHFSITSLLANDTDVDNAHGDLTITAVQMDPLSAANGSVSIVGGQIVFAPTLNFNGQASFSYTVSDGVGGESQATVNLNFDPINDAPVANSELVFGKRDVGYTLTQAALLANDTDVETPGNMRISSISNVQHGSAILNPDGSVRFVPTAGYAGRGSFDYAITDPDGASSTATAQIDFSRVNTSPLTTDDSFSGFEDVPFSITAAQLLVNDSDADNATADLRVVAVSGATNGTVSLQPDGSVRFLGTRDFNGSASFNYQVSDGDGGLTWARAQLTLQSVNDAPIIEDVWGGRPVYGSIVGPQYITGYDESGNPLYAQDVTPIYDEGYARSLYNSGQLGGSLYQNGHLKPAYLNYLDSYQTIGESGAFYDDPYRQNGGIVAYDVEGDAITYSISSSPQHGHAWANQYTNLGAPDSIDHTQAAPYWVGETGAWQYYSQRGDGYTGVDYFTMRATDSGGAFVDRVIGVTHAGSPAAGGGGGGKKPVTLDLDGNGLHYIGLDDSQAYFDVNNDGWREHLAWVSAGDAFLVLDKGADRVIDRFDEISFTGYLPGARTDLEGLAAFDSNGDGLLSRLDTRWREFAVWQDADGNGISAPAEVHTLDDTGIMQISLSSDQLLRQVDGVTEFGQTRFTWADGRTGAVGDVALPLGDTVLAAVLPGVPVAPALSPEHMALLMVQMISTVTATQDTEPLSLVPMSDAPDLQLAVLAAQAQWEQAAQLQAA